MKLFFRRTPKFKPVGDRGGHVRDAVTGLDIICYGQPDYGQIFVVTSRDKRSFEMGTIYQAKFLDRAVTASDRSNPAMMLFVPHLERAAQFRNGTIEQNTEFVRLVLDGLALMNRLWPVAPSAFFYTNRHNCTPERLASLSFVLPSEEEILRLFER